MCAFRGVARLVPQSILKTEGLKWMAVVFPFFFLATKVVYFSPRTDILPSMWFGEAAGKGKGKIFLHSSKELEIAQTTH